MLSSATSGASAKRQTQSVGEPIETGMRFAGRVSAARDGNTTIIYLGEHQTEIWAYGLPRQPGEYDVDIIDTWTMSVTPAERIAAPEDHPVRHGAVKPGARTRRRLCRQTSSQAKPRHSHPDNTVLTSSAMHNKSVAAACPVRLATCALIECVPVRRRPATDRLPTADSQCHAGRQGLARPLCRRCILLRTNQSPGQSPPSHSPRP